MINQTFDYLQAVFWSLTYILLIIYAFFYKTHGIPIFAVCLNYGWETVALLQALLSGSFDVFFLIHATWFGLDTIIFALYLCYETPIIKNLSAKICWIFLLLAVIASEAFLFRTGYMLLSCFVIDLLMAISFLLFVGSKAAEGAYLAVAIGITKLLGDLFAWLQYRNPCYKESYFVNLIGIIVLICNILYIVVLLFKHRMKGHKQYDQSI